MFWVELAPRGLGCGFSKIVFSALHCAHQPGGWAGGGRASEAGNRVNQVWERGEIVMSIAVPDRCILAESNQLIKYSSPSNSQTEALKQKANALGLSVMQHKLVGHFWWEWPVKQKNVHFAGLAPPTSA